MDKNITKIIIAIVLIIIAIFTVTNMLIKSKAKKQEFVILPTQDIVSPPKPDVIPKQPVRGAVPIKTAVLPGKEVIDDWKRDPFIIIEKDLVDIERKFSSKAEFKKPELSQLKLTGIIFAKEKSADNYAVISDQLLKVGDQIMGFKVTEIKPNSVILKWENQEFILELWQEQPK